MKCIQIGKKEVKAVTVSADMILNKENTINNIKNLLEIKNELSKVAACKINIRNLLHFFTLKMG